MHSTAILYAVLSSVVASLVQAQDATSGPVQEIICERTDEEMFMIFDLELACPSPYLVQIQNANFGRTDTTTCPKAGKDAVSDCVQSSSLAVLRGLCDDKATCTVAPTVETFGDPCPGIYKFLDLTYTCIDPSNPPTTTPTAAPANPTTTTPPATAPPPECATSMSECSQTCGGGTITETTTCQIFDVHGQVTGTESQDVVTDCDNSMPCPTTSLPPSGPDRIPFTGKCTFLGKIHHPSDTWSVTLHRRTLDCYCPTTIGRLESKKWKARDYCTIVQVCVDQTGRHEPGTKWRRALPGGRQQECTCPPRQHNSFRFLFHHQRQCKGLCRGRYLSGRFYTRTGQPSGRVLRCRCSASGVENCKNQRKKGRKG